MVQTLGTPMTGVAEACTLDKVGLAIYCYHAERGGVYMEMRLNQLRELLESRREYVTTESASQRITEIQRDLDLLENEYAQEIRDLLNGTGYNVQTVSFNIDIVREIGNEEPPIRWVKVKRKLRPILGDQRQEPEGHSESSK